jgi:hypothetical protein
MAFIGWFRGTLKVLLPLGAGAALAGAIAWGASGGGPGGTRAPAAPTEAAAAATAAPEKTPGPPWDSRRPDCPQGWAVYNDPDGYFSLCYPPGLEAGGGTRVAGAAEGATFSAGDPGQNGRSDATNVFSLNIAWRSGSGLGAGLPTNDNCPTYATLPNVINSQFVRMNFGGRTLTGCITKGRLTLAPPPALEVDEIRLWLPVSPDGSDSRGYVRIRVGYVGPDLLGTFVRARQILETLQFQ